MVLSVSSIGDNAQTPGGAAETYIPDQLIAGNLKLVTDNVTVGGSAVLQRGSLLGQISLGTLASSAGKTYGSGTIVVALVPTAADTLTVAGTVITFVASNPTGNQVLIGATVGATAQNLLAFLNGSSDANIIKMTYALTAAATITATAVILGVAGNAYTLATSHSAAFTVPATLSSGTDNTGVETIGTLSLGASAMPGKYLVVLTGATTANVFDPRGDLIGPATVGTAFLNSQIGFTITTGAGIAAGDQFSLSAAPGTGQYVLATAAATDGSQTPLAVLADVADPTSGAVNAGVYVMGEFNYTAMTFGAGITVAAAKAALTPRGIFLKSVVSATDPA